MNEKLLAALEYFGLFTAIIIVTIIVAWLVNRFFRRLIRRSTTDMKNDPTNYHFLRHGISAIIYLVGLGTAIYNVPDLRALASSLLAGAGILAVAVGFASQHALSNIISGLFMVIFKPFRIGDRLKIREMVGIVEDITLRHTVIRDFENKRILIPNAVISDEIIVNSDFADDRICRWIDIGISYDSDIDRAKKIMESAVMAHPLHIDPRTPQDIEKGTAEVPVRVISFGESSVNLRAWAWAKDSAEGFILYCDLLETIKKQFDSEGIEIPFPHRTLVYKTKAVDEKPI